MKMSELETLEFEPEIDKLTWTLQKEAIQYDKLPQTKFESFDNSLRYQMSNNRCT